MYVFVLKMIDVDRLKRTTALMALQGLNSYSCHVKYKLL